MAKRKKVSSTHTSLRLSPDLLEGVARIAGDTGWSNAKVIGFLASLGRLVINNNDAAVLLARGQLIRQVKIHQVELENERRLADARREARTPGAAPGWRKATAAVARATKARAAAKPAASPAAAKPA